VARYNLEVHHLILIPFWQKYCCENKLSNSSLMFTSSSHFLCAAEQNTETQYTHTHNTHTRPFNGPLSRTTLVSRYQKGKTNLDFTEARDSEWQWHQLGHMHGNTIIAKNRLMHVVVHGVSSQCRFLCLRRRGGGIKRYRDPSVCLSRGAAAVGAQLSQATDTLAACSLSMCGPVRGRT